MHNNQTTSSRVLERRKRKVAYTLVDQDLNFLGDNDVINEWIGLKSESLAGRAIFELFPELRGAEAKLQQLFHDPASVVVLSALQRQTAAAGKRYFDLQIEAAPHQASALTLTLIDVTPQPLSPSSASSSTTQTALEDRNRDLLRLNRAGRILTSTLEMEEVLERLLQVAVQIIGAEGSSVWLWDEETPTEWLVCRAAFHQSHDPELVGQRLRAGQGIAGWTALNGKSAMTASTRKDARFFPNVDAESGFNTLSLLAVPLQIREETMGVLEVVNKIDGQFDQDDLEVAESLAAFASIAIYNAYLVTQLQQQKQDLQARNEELDAFAHTVAHDLQNPMAAILNFAELMRRDNAQIPAETHKRLLRSFVQNAHKISNIVQELLLLSTVRKIDVKSRPLDMPRIVDSALTRLSYMLDDYNAEIIMPDTWLPARGHAPWIEEVWENYLSNALKYGGRPPRVELGSTLESDGMVRFWVRDNGDGLTPEAQKKLFVPFTKLSQLKANSTGLGLSIARRIVEKLGGQVSLESQVGGGSEFSFTLPAIEEEKGD